MKARLIMVMLIALSLSGGCSKQPPSNANAGPPSSTCVADKATADGVMPPDEQNKPWKGDFDAMAERRVIRALVVYSRTFYFVDGAEQHGSTYEGLKEFENVINKQLGTNALKVHVAFIPVTRDQLLPALVEGRGDIAAANLSITGKRLASVDSIRTSGSATSNMLRPRISARRPFSTLATFTSTTLRIVRSWL